MESKWGERDGPKREAQPGLYFIYHIYVIVLRQFSKGFCELQEICLHLESNEV